MSYEWACCESTFAPSVGKAVEERFVLLPRGEHDISRFPLTYARGVSVALEARPGKLEVGKTLYRAQFAIEAFAGVGRLAMRLSYSPDRQNWTSMAEAGWDAPESWELLLAAPSSAFVRARLDAFGTSACSAVVRFRICPAFAQMREGLGIQGYDNKETPRS